MATTIADEMKMYLASLTATNVICSDLGATFLWGTNLTIGAELNSSICLTIIPTGGGPPTDKDKQNSSVSIQFKTQTRQKALSIMQSVINHLHLNSDCAIPKGKIYAVQSTPILLGVREGGQSVIAAANFNIKHVKF